jgi:phenylalanyl-tRNA synthetase alpha chain
MRLFLLPPGGNSATIPFMETPKGHIHPLSHIIRDMVRIFDELGFSYAEGPELESEYYNFDALNVPRDHPSRDMQDTFFIEGKPGFVMRTHTSPVQIRYMQEHGAPLRIIVPGKVFRNEATDMTHEAQFYQLEGLMVGEGVSMAHLKGTLTHFFEEFFLSAQAGKGSVEIRFRPSFFPFVEPGVEVDMRLISPDAPEKLRGRWIEMMGAGMVHPNVLRAGNIDPEKYSGFAFGMGIDRLALLYFGIDDVRLSYAGDLRFVNQF